MDHSQINGSNGFDYDPSAWDPNMNVNQPEPAFVFDGDDSVPVGPQGYGGPSQSSAAYGQPQSHVGGYDMGYQAPQYHQYSQRNNIIQHNATLQTNHHGPDGALMNGYPQAYDAGHSASPPMSQTGYSAPRVGSPYVLQPSIGHGMDGYNDPRLTNDGFVQQNGAPQQPTPGPRQIRQGQYFTDLQPPQQPTPPVQQQHRVSTPQRLTPDQLLYAQAQQKQALTPSLTRPQQQVQAPQDVQQQLQQQQLLLQQAFRAQAQQRAPNQHQQVPAPLHQTQLVGHQQIAVQQQQQFQQVPPPFAAQHILNNTPAAPTQAPAYSQQQRQPGLAVPDRWLVATPPTVAPTPTNSEKWTGMHNAYVSNVTERHPEKLARERLLPVFARTERRRLFSERPMLIPAEALGRYIDSLKLIATNDPQAGVKHLTRRLVLHHDLRRTDALDEETLESYDKVPKSGPSKFQAEAKKRSFELPPLALASSVGELNMLEVKTAAVLDLPTTWNADDALVRKVAAEFEEFLGKVVSDFRSTPEYKLLLDFVIANKTKTSLPAEEIARGNMLREEVNKGRERVYRVVTTALCTADDRIFGVLNPGRIGRPFQIVTNLFNTGDMNAPLTKALLNFAGRIPFLDESAVTEFKWSKVLPKLEDGGDDEVKAAVKKIRDIIRSNKGKPPSMPPKVDASPALNGQGPSKKTAVPAKANGPSSGTAGAGQGPTSASCRPHGASSTNRPREDDGEGRVNKKPAIGSSTSQSSTTQAASSQSSSHQTSAAVGPTKTAPSASILNALKSRVSTGVLAGKIRPPKKILSGVKSDVNKPDRTDPENKTSSNAQSKTSVTSKPEVFKPTITSSSKTSSSDTSKMTSKGKPERTDPENKTSSSSTSGFAALMSEIEKPKAVKRPAPAEPEKDEAPINETESERELRERKEKRRRRGLHVSFKPEPELTEVRIFHMQQPEDNQLDEHNMVRDANDDKAEGALLKASRSSQIDSDREWEDPTLIDFTVIPEEQRKKTFTSRGGLIKVDTDEMKVMAEKSKTELMVVYTDLADIPDSPAEPRPDNDDDFVPAGVDVPRDSNLDARAALYMACGPRGGLEHLLKRKTAATTSTAAMLVNKVQAANPYENYDNPQVRRTKDEQVLQALMSGAARNYVDPDPVHPQMSRIRRDYADPATQAASKALEAVVAQLSGLPAPPQEPPMWQQDPARRQEWITGYNNDQRAEEAARQAVQQSAMLAQNYNNQAQAAQQANPYAQYYAQYKSVPQGNAQQQQQPATDPLAATLAALSSATGGQPAAAQANPLQALLAAFGTQPTQATSAVDPNQALQLAMWAAASGGAQQQQPPQAAQQQYDYSTTPATGQPGYDNNPNNQREDAAKTSEHRRGGRRGGKDHKDGGGGRGGAADDSGGDDDHLRGINRSLIGTKPCTFWVRGNCNRGEKCTFRHDARDLQQ